MAHGKRIPQEAGLSYILGDSKGWATLSIATHFNCNSALYVGLSAIRSSLSYTHSNNDLQRTKMIVETDSKEAFHLVIGRNEHPSAKYHNILREIKHIIV